MTTEIYMAIITGLIGVVGFFLTRSFAALDKKADKSDLDVTKADIEAIRKTVADVKDNYLTKEDFLREQLKTEKKLDKIMDTITYAQPPRTVKNRLYRNTILIFVLRTTRLRFRHSLTISALRLDLEQSIISLMQARLLQQRSTPATSRT